MDAAGDIAGVWEASASTQKSNLPANKIAARAMRRFGLRACSDFGAMRLRQAGDCSGVSVRMGICSRSRRRRPGGGVRPLKRGPGAAIPLPLHCTRLTVARGRSQRACGAERMSEQMRLCWKVWAATVLLALPVASNAANCTTQAELLAPDRNALVAAGGRLSEAVMQQDYGTLQAALLPAEAAEWDGMRGAVEQAAPLLKGGQLQLRSLYLLDATTLQAPADTQFFCSNASGSLTVTITMRALPPGRYAVALADAAGAPMGGQMGLILAWDPTSSPSRWRLAGLSVRPGIFDGHDGVWYWERARALANGNQPWGAWYSYEAARWLLVPVDFLSSPNLEKLGQEQVQIKNSPQEAFPLSVPDGDRTWKIDAVRLDTSLHQADLGVAYESTGVTDPAAVRTEAIAVLSAFLKAQPGLRENFHGLWAYAVQNGNPAAGVGNQDVDLGGIAPRLHADLPSLPVKLHGIRQQVDQRLFQPVAGAVHQQILHGTALQRYLAPRRLGRDR